VSKTQRDRAFNTTRNNVHPCLHVLADVYPCPRNRQQYKQQYTPSPAPPRLPPADYSLLRAAITTRERQLFLENELLVEPP